MKTIINLARMEFQKLFYSPIAWLVLIIFSIQSGVQFMQIANNWIIRFALGYGTDALTKRFYADTMGFFSLMQNTLYLYIPLITMGLLSKEFNSGSIKLLYSSPITNIQIVLGKYLAALGFSVAMIAILFLESIFGFLLIKDFDFPQVLAGLLGIFLIMATYSAIGLFMSSLTSYQIVAAIGSFAVFFVLQQIGNLWQTVNFVKNISYWLSIKGRSQTFIQGLICSDDLLYFIIVSALFVAFTVFRLKGIREKSSKYVSVLRYATFFMFVALVGYISTIPIFMKYFDATRTNLNTLTENSQQVLEKLKGKVKITTYDNVLGEYNYVAMPSSQKSDESNFKSYQRFYPNIDLEYKYYYDIPIQEEFAKSYKKRYDGLTINQTLEKVCNLYDMDKDAIRPGKDYTDEIDLKSELNRTVRKIETTDGKVSYLRIYDDLQVLPSESQITAAFKNLVADLPVVGFVTGHGEREINMSGPRSYNNLVQQKSFRWSLINNGFQIKELELSSPVDQNINILVIPDPKKPMSGKEQNNLNSYINRGGNLLLTSDVNHQNITNPLVSRFGITFIPGQIVEHNKDYPLNLITAKLTEKSKEIAYQMEDILRVDGVISMDGAVGISFDKKNEFNYIPILVSDTVKNITQLDFVGSWNELQTTNFIDDVAKYNEGTGEQVGPFITALALTRTVRGKKQKIMVLGDSDCFSNEEFSKSRKGIKAKNFDMANGIFFWLSDNVSPIDTRRPQNPDNGVLLKKSQLGFYKILYQMLIPALLAGSLLLIWLKRRRR